jgi:hypothetical protein
VTENGSISAISVPMPLASTPARHFDAEIPGNSGEVSLN